MNCPKPNCNAPTLKKIINVDGSFYYACSTCGYITKVSIPSIPIIQYLKNIVYSTLF